MSATVEKVASEIGAQALAEVVNWDDRTSPEEWPDHLLITGDELQKLFERQIVNYFIDNPERLLVQPDLEAFAEAIDAARFAHPQNPRDRDRAFADADPSDREYATRLARAVLNSIKNG